MLQKKTAKAYAVLSIIIDRTEEAKLKDYIIESYVNGREHGFAISNWPKSTKVAFSENRNSDSIVVYMGRTIDFSMQGNTPDESVYTDGREFFNFCDYLGAAEAIMKFLEQI